MIPNERQIAYARLVRSIKDYRPRYRLTQPGLPESERLELKVKLFIQHDIAKALIKDERQTCEMEKPSSQIKHAERKNRSMANPR